MKTFLVAAAMGAALTFGVGQAGAVTITFDDQASLVELEDGYADLQWDGFFTINGGVEFGDSGFENGAVSDGTVASNIGGEPASFSSATLFTLNDFFLTAAWSNDLNVQVVGRRGGVDIFTTNLVVDYDGPTHVVLGWESIDEVFFVSSGGVDANFDDPGEGTHFAIDNLTLTTAAVPVPEPATWALMILGFGLAGAGLRARRGCLAT